MLKQIVAFAGALVLLASLNSCKETANAKKEIKLASFKDSVSYSIGQNMGGYLKSMKLDLDMDVFNKAIDDALQGNESMLTPEEMMAVSKKMQEDQMKKMQAKGDENKVAGEKFLAENKTKEGVVTTESGLQYKVIKEGKGLIPTIDHTVKVHYTGTLLDGTKFDSSVDRGKPAEFPVGGVIKGWTEALQLMKVGSKYQLFIPSDLAYGERGAGADILPNSTLIFDVELLEIVKK